MTTPPRLIESKCSPMVRQLLDVARAERAPRSLPGRALARAASALSLTAIGSVHAAAGAAANTTTAGIAASTTAAGVAASTTAAAPIGLTVLGIGKIFGAGVVLGTALLSGASWVAQPGPGPTLAPSVGRVAVQVTPPHLPTTGVASQTPGEVSSTAGVSQAAGEPFPPKPGAPQTNRANQRTNAPVAGGRRDTGSPSANPGATGGASPSSLADEMGLVDEARQAIADGRAEAAFAALERYRSTYPSGRLGPECEALEVEALALRGEKAAARTRAQQFLQQHPASPLVERVRRRL